MKAPDLVTISKKILTSVDFWIAKRRGMGAKAFIRPLVITATTLWLMVPVQAFSQTTNVVVLSQEEMIRLRSVLGEHRRAKDLYDSIVALMEHHVTDSPAPVEVIYYEGLLETDPRRIQTTASLTDIDKVVNIIYRYYGDPQPALANRAAKFVLAWAKTYRPTGNTINENKLVPLFWAYYLFRERCSADERKLVENWMTSIARAQMDRPKTPMNNWEAKRLKIIGTAGCISDDEDFKTFSIRGFKNYIGTAYYRDGTSNDLKERDALSYHVSGLTPCIASFATLKQFDKRFDLFHYEAASGASIAKAVRYTLPYATGEKTRKEWVNTKVELDKRRAAAGIAEYQPGILFHRAKAIPMLEWACYFNSGWFEAIGSRGKGTYTATWIGMLNSPLVRQ